MSCCHTPVYHVSNTPKDLLIHVCAYAFELKQELILVELTYVKMDVPNSLPPFLLENVI